MDWGGIIAGAMGGGAKAVGEMADDTMKRRDLELAQQRAEQVAIKGEERRAVLQRENAAYEMDLKLKREDEQGKRYQAQTDQITDKAKTMDSERQVGSMTKLRDSLPQEGEFAGQAISAKDIASLPPEARAAYEKAGLIERSSGSQQLRDQIDAARSIGADKPVRDDLRTSLSAQMAAEEKVRKEARDDRTDLRKEKKDEETTRQTDERLKIEGRRAEAMVARANSSGGGGANSAPKLRSTFDGSDGRKMAVMSDGTTRELSASSLAFNKEVSKIVTNLEKTDFKFKRLSPEEKREIAVEQLTAAKSGGGSEPAPTTQKPATSTKPATQTSKAITQAEYNRLPSGATFTAPDGTTRTKP